jgi:hypothetical protein
MRTPDKHPGPAFYSILLLLLTLGVFASPFTRSWLGFHAAWYFPYLLWGGVIFAAALLRGRSPDDDA